MKKFPYEFFMRSILSENLSKYEIKMFIIMFIIIIMWTGPIMLSIMLTSSFSLFL